MNLKFIQKYRIPIIVKTFKTKNKFGELALPDFQDYNEFMVIKTFPEKIEKKSVECPEIRPH